MIDHNPHNHHQYVEGCFRCDLSRVEVTHPSLARGLAQAARGEAVERDDLLGED